MSKSFFFRHQRRATFVVSAFTVGLCVLGAREAAAQAKAAFPGRGEIVVAVRYLQPTGVSHAHLYLYREDGRLLRQLTDDNTGQDSSPVFAPDGETIVWTCTKPNNIKEYWSVRPRGNDLKRLSSAPDWYKPSSSNSPYFTSPNSSEYDKQSPPRFRAPDGSVELELRRTSEDDEINGPGSGKGFLLRDLKKGTETSLGSLPGFYGAFDLLQDKNEPDRRFLMDGALQIAFFSLHLNSTDGSTVFALDLPKRRLVRLSPNGAVPFPLSGEAAFLTLTDNRYVPFSSEGKTANCDYVERWDADLHKIRYARAGAARCYGASLYRPELTPAIVTIANPDEN